MRQIRFKPFILVKVSGDCIGDKRVEDETRELFSDYFVYFIHGAGKQFNEALEEAGAEYHFDAGIREMDQQAIKICYEGPQRRILEYYQTVFNTDIGLNIIIIPPIARENGELVNINADVMFERLYGKGIFERGVVYTMNGRDKAHLQKEGVEIRYL